MKWGILISLFLCFNALLAQDNPYWWEDLHGIERGTPWAPEMVVSPGYLGPNALPVPNQVKGKVSSSSYVEMATEFHTMPGDWAFNFLPRIFYSVADGKMAFEFYGYSFERYRSSMEIRDFRKSRYYNPDRWEAGDYYFSTQIQLIKDNNKWPDMALRAGCKTASGALIGMRYTDTPAYWFDYSLGKDNELDNSNIRWYAMLGFYCWQTTTAKWLQNDAYLYGLGFEWQKGNFGMENSIQGYSGYWEDLDKPINYRMQVKYAFKKHALGLQWQAGLRHVVYQSFRVSWKYNIR